MLKKLRKLVADDRLLNLDPDSDEFLSVHHAILESKPMMKHVFEELYDTCLALDKRFFTQRNQKRVEIGAGVSFIKERDATVITSDIKSAPNLDMVVDALNMPFEKNSISALFALNCFHHLPDPTLFFQELDRVLAPGGGCVLIEPYHGPVASVFYKNLFDSETFDKGQSTWINYNQGVMNGANQALSFIVFKRDLKKFQAQFPNLEVVENRVFNNYLRYLFSGGLNFKQLVPSQLEFVLKFAEWILYPLNTILGLHHYIAIRKKV